MKPKRKVQLWSATDPPAFRWIGLPEAVRFWSDQFRARKGVYHEAHEAHEGEWKTWRSNMIEHFDYRRIAKELSNDIQGVPLRNTPNLRRLRRKYSKRLAQASAKQVLDFVRYFTDHFNYRWIAFEMVYCHEAAIESIGVKELEEFGKKINTWGASDIFAGFLAGPAWRNGQVPDELILSWAKSTDYWWRRTALVSTIPLNRRSAGGQGDVGRTLKICRTLVADKNDMVIKALSWALRELIPHDREAVVRFLLDNEDVLAARVKREVRNKLRTGVKNPGRR